MTGIKLQDIVKITDRIEIHISLLPEGSKTGYVFTSKRDGCKYGSYLVDYSEHLEDVNKCIKPLLEQAGMVIEQLLRGGEAE